MPSTPIAVSDLNSLDQDSFVAALDFVFEGPPWIVAEAWHARPFADLAALHQALCAVMFQAPVEQKIALIQSHPDLVGKAALAGTLTPASTNEQAAAGLNRLTPEEIATFNRLNAAYRERFGFPFVICARENKKASILAGFEARLHNSREQEIATALNEVAKIAHLRLRDAIISDED
jgi:2-oxo-4-hydroxy-4-carboxy-5-ureidoimidazoline decarboxylase